MTTYTESRYISCADTAKLVRKALKEAFPTIKFFVKSKEYSGGASITIAWQDGPVRSAVDAIVDPFKGADEMNGEKVRYGSDYIHTERALSEALVTKVAQLYCQRYNKEMPEIKISEVSGAYIDTFDVIRDEIMPLAYDVDGSEIATLALCISNNKLSIKHADTVEDIVCVCCHYYSRAEDIQMINDKPVCHLCIKAEVAVLTDEDIALPVLSSVDATIAQAAQVCESIEQALQTIPLTLPRLKDGGFTPLTVKVLPQPVIKKSSPAMPKNEQVDYRVLDVLKRGRIEGNRYYLPQGQLERKLYEQVNEVLTRIGGKWTSGKIKAHVFAEVAPTPLLELIFETCEMPPKNPTAFFPTPLLVAEELLNNSALQRLPKHTRRILEPSAGKGDLASAVRAHCQMHGINGCIECCEIVPRFQGVLRDKGFAVIDEADFLQYVPDSPYDAVVMNPPFSVEGDTLAYVTHIEHAWSLLTDGGVLLAVVPAGFVFRDDKRIKQLRKLVEEHGAWVELSGGAFAESGTGVKTALISMQK